MKLLPKSKPGAPTAGAQPTFQPIDRVNLLALLDRIVNNGEACVVRLREPRGMWTYAFQGGGLIHASGGAVRGARQAFDLLWEFQQGEVSMTAGTDPSLSSNLYIDKGRLVDLIRRSQGALQGPGSPYIPPDQQRPVAPVHQPWPPQGQRPPMAPPGWNPAQYPQAYPAQPGYQPPAAPPGYPAAAPPGYPAGGPPQYPAPAGYPTPYPPQAPYPAPPAQPPVRPQPPQAWPGYPPQPPQMPPAPPAYPQAAAQPAPAAPPVPMAPPQPPVMPQPPQAMPRPQPMPPARPAAPPSFNVPPMPLPKPRGTVNIPGRAAPPSSPALTPPPPPPPAPPGPATPVDELKTLRATLVSQAPAAPPAVVGPPPNWGLRGPGGAVAPVPAPAPVKGRAPKAAGPAKPSPFKAWARVKLITFLLWACERRYSPDDHWTVKDAFEVATLELRDQFIGAFSQLGQNAKSSGPQSNEFEGDQIASGRTRGRSRGRRR